jgi:hypothetical protein
MEGAGTTGLLLPTKRQCGCRDAGVSRFSARNAGFSAVQATGYLAPTPQES